MKRILLLLIITVIGWSAFSQNINKVEYFIDTDPGYGSATNVPVTADAAINNLSFTVPITSITDGFHTLFIRSQDANNKWSLVVGRPLVKISIPSVTPAVNLVEYFIDTDPGYGSGTSVTFTAGTAVTNQSFAVPLTSVSDGFHTLYMRTKDASNNWSLVANRPFVKLAIPSVAPNVTLLEYFVDTDPGYGSGTSVTITEGSAITNQSFTVSLSSLSDGFHTLYMRTKDANNNWSLVANRPFVKVAIPSLAPNITNVEYFVDTDPGYGSGTAVTITPAAAISDLNFTADVSTQTPGAHKLFVRSKDANNKWSLVYTKDFTVCNQSPTTAGAATAVTSSGFTANWSAVSEATGYRLDVSTDNFITFVTGYNDKDAGNVTTLAITSLTPGTAYQYRIRTVGTCTSVNSASIDVSTPIAVPSAPTASAATAVSATGFTANWSAVTGATSYLIDISTDNFVSFITGYNAKSITTTSEVVTGMTATTAYMYRVRAANDGGVSASSSTISVTTLTDAPVAAAASAITTTSFDANWATVTGATSYRLDVSTDNFTTLLTGYSDKNVGNVLTSGVTGLTTGVAYTYRVRAVNATGASDNSNSIDVTTTTAPAAPVANAATTTTTTGFTANWTAVAAATDYRLDVSADNFATFVTGYNNKTVTSTSDEVTGLTPATAYQYRVRAVNANGTSVNSNVIDATTLSKQDQSVTFETIADKTLGDAAFDPGATASSLLTVVYSTASDKVTITGSSVALVKAGSIVLNADQAGDDNFNAAARASQTFCVNPAKPTIALTGSGTETITLTSSNNAGNQWYLNGTEITSGSGATLTIASSANAGSYTVKTTVDNCSSLISDAKIIVVTGDLERLETEMILFPNPAKDKLVVRLVGFAEGKAVAIEVYDLLGRSIAETNGMGGTDVTIDISRYASGNYFLQASQDKLIQQRKFIKE